MNNTNQLNQYIKNLSRTASKNTLKNYPPRVEKFLTWLDNKEITKQLVTEFLDSLEGREQTINGYKVAISSYCDFIGMEVNPTKEIKIKKDSKNPEITVVTDEMFQKLIENTKKEYTLEKELRYKLIFTLGQKCGMRVNEILTLEAKDIGLDYLIIRDTKNGTTRRIPISDEVSSLIQEYMKINKNSQLFNIGYSAVMKRLKKYCEDLDIPYGQYTGITMHSTRHARATELVIKNKMPIALVAQYMGNSPETLQSRYLHASFEDMKQLL